MFQFLFQIHLTQFFDKKSGILEHHACIEVSCISYCQDHKPHANQHQKVQNYLHQFVKQNFQTVSTYHPFYQKPKHQNKSIQTCQVLFVYSLLNTFYNSKQHQDSKISILHHFSIWKLVRVQENQEIYQMESQNINYTYNIDYQIGV